MKRVLIKCGVLLCTFIISLIVLGNLMNRGNTDLTAEMEPATYPLLYMITNGQRYNPLHGYCKTMDTAFERETITVLSPDRATGIEIDDYGCDIRSISYEVRDLSGERLIENTEITDFNTTDTGVMADFVIKDLIKENTEYSLCILVDIGDDIVHYYTRIIWAQDYHVDSKIDFALDFSNKTFNKDEAQSIRKYLESNSLGDNTSFSKVNIHSSFSQVTWGDMQVIKLTEPVPSITQITDQTAVVSFDYYVASGEAEEQKIYSVEEFYRVRYTDTRMYLLEFERRMEQVLCEDNVPVENSRLNLGIINKDFEITESEDGSIMVFKNRGRLFSYSLSDNKLSIVFGYYGANDTDPRTTYDKHDMKVLSVDETGNVRFIVYGYLNRGRHEGDVGIQVYSYDGALNTLEEETFIPYERSASILMDEMESLHYVNKENTLFLILGRATYAIDLNTRKYDIMMEQEGDNAMYVSASGEMVVWQTSQDAFECEELLLMDLETHSTAAIDSDPGDYIQPLGFIGEDLVYGVAHGSDIVKDASGDQIFPMYAVYIRNSAGAILKTYKQEGVYVVGGEIKNNQITLKRVKKKGELSYEETSSDQIMNSVETADGRNTVTYFSDDVYKGQVAITFKNTASKKTIQVRNPKEIMFEGNREVNLKLVSKDDTLYYTYGILGLEGIFANPSNAVLEAYETAGVVINDTGDYVFVKGNRSSRNQIMSITATQIEGVENSVSVCLDTILNKEGIVRNTRTELAGGKSAYKVLKDSLAEADVLDLSGCPLDAILYYVNKDIPVMAILDNGEAVLITGFNEVAVVIMDPVSGTLSKKNMSEASEWFTRNGNEFITYAKPTPN